MSSTDNDVLRLMCGLPIVFDDVCLVYSPTLREIAAEGYDRFHQYLSYVLITKPAMENKELEELLSPLTDFEFLILLS